MHKQDHFLFSDMHIKHFIWPHSNKTRALKIKIILQESSSRCSSVFIPPCVFFFKVTEFLKPPEGHGALDVLRRAKWPWKVWIQVRRRKNTQIAVTGIFHDSSNLILFFSSSSFGVRCFYKPLGVFVASTALCLYPSFFPPFFFFFFFQRCMCK